MAAPRPDPEELLRQSRAGDGTAAGQLLELYRNYLGLLGRVQLGRQLQGKVDASDLVQEVFLAAHRGLAGFRGTTEAELVCWLRQVLAARLADLVRRFRGTRRRDLRLERRLADELDRSSQAVGGGLVGPGSSPSEGAVRRERAVLLADALQELPDDYREVIVLHHFQGADFTEVAARMSRSQDSVRKLWMRGLARLRRGLGDDV
jgi:RNA polymerase sigma-70 factor, ECF subfamily